MRRLRRGQSGFLLAGFLLAGLLMLAMLVPAAATPATGEAEPLPEAALWSALADGSAAALMRHAFAPGSGDPPGFDLADCATQRNLDAAGREQARRAGDAFRRNGIETATVLSSAWCRSHETAEELGLGPVAIRPALNSFFGDRSQAAASTAGLRRILADWRGQGPLVLVTHQVNITALIGAWVRSGEVVVVGADAEARLLGRLPLLALD